MHVAFHSMPMLAIVEINSGIPEVQKPFWASKTPDDLYSIYKCLSVTPSKVLALLNEPLFASRVDAVVYGYLRPYWEHVTGAGLYLLEVCDRKFGLHSR